MCFLKVMLFFAAVVIVTTAATANNQPTNDDLKEDLELLEPQSSSNAKRSIDYYNPIITNDCSHQYRYIRCDSKYKKLRSRNRRGRKNRNTYRSRNRLKRIPGDSNDKSLPGSNTFNISEPIADTKTLNTIDNTNKISTTLKNKTVDVMDNSNNNTSNSDPVKDSNNLYSDVPTTNTTTKKPNDNIELINTTTKMYEFSTVTEKITLNTNVTNPKSAESETSSHNPLLDINDTKEENKSIIIDKDQNIQPNFETKFENNNNNTSTISFVTTPINEAKPSSKSYELASENTQVESKNNVTENTNTKNTTVNSSGTKEHIAASTYNNIFSDKNRDTKVNNTMSKIKQKKSVSISDFKNFNDTSKKEDITTKLQTDYKSFDQIDSKKSILVEDKDDDILISDLEYVLTALENKNVFEDQPDPKILNDKEILNPPNKQVLPTLRVPEVLDSKKLDLKPTKLQSDDKQSIVEKTLLESKKIEPKFKTSKSDTTKQYTVHKYHIDSFTNKSEPNLISKTKEKDIQLEISEPKYRQFHLESIAPKDNKNQPVDLEIKRNEPNLNPDTKERDIHVEITEPKYKQFYLEPIAPKENKNQPVDFKSKKIEPRNVILPTDFKSQSDPSLVPLDTVGKNKPTSSNKEEIFGEPLYKDFDSKYREVVLEFENNKTKDHVLKALNIDLNQKPGGSEVPNYHEVVLEFQNDKPINRVFTAPIIGSKNKPRVQSDPKIIKIDDTLPKKEPKRDIVIYTTATPGIVEVVREVSGPEKHKRTSLEAKGRSSNPDLDGIVVELADSQRDEKKNRRPELDFKRRYKEPRPKTQKFEPVYKQRKTGYDKKDKDVKIFERKLENPKPEYEEVVIEFENQGTKNRNLDTSFQKPEPKGAGLTKIYKKPISKYKKREFRNPKPRFEYDSNIEHQLQQHEQGSSKSKINQDIFRDRSSNPKYKNINPKTYQKVKTGYEQETKTQDFNPGYRHRKSKHQEQNDKVLVDISDKEINRLIDSLEERTKARKVETSPEQVRNTQAFTPEYRHPESKQKEPNEKGLIDISDKEINRLIDSLDETTKQRKPSFETVIYEQSSSKDSIEETTREGKVKTSYEQETNTQTLKPVYNNRESKDELNDKVVIDISDKEVNQFIDSLDETTKRRKPSFDTVIYEQPNPKIRPTKRKRYQNSYQKYGSERRTVKGRKEEIGRKGLKQEHHDEKSEVYPNEDKTTEKETFFSKFKFW